jgi:hypothetical protein
MSNKVVNLDFPINDLDGREVGNAGTLMASILMSETKGDAIKLFDWAMSFHKKQDVSMDASDFSKFKGMLSENDKITVLAKGQILKYLDTLK